MGNEATVRDRALAAFCAAATIVGAAWYCFVAWTQWAANRTFLADVGVFNALASGPWHGTWLRTPLAPDAAGNYFGIHFQPYLLLLTPLYGIADHPLTLLFAQSLHLAFAAAPWAMFVYGLTRSRAATAGAVVLYLCGHFTLSLHLAAHPESLAMPWIFTLFLAAQRRSARLFFPALALALATKEDYALWLLAWCATLLFDRDTRRLGIWGCAVCAGWLLASFAIMHACGAAEYDALGMKPAARFASMGDTTGAIALHALTHPVAIVGRVLREPLLGLLLGTGLLSLLDPRTAWVGVFGAAAFMATDDPFVGDLAYYYSYASFPFFLYSTARGAAWLLARAPESRALHRGIGLWFAAVGIAGFLLPTRTDGLRHRPFEVTERNRVVGEFLGQALPSDASVVAQYDLYNRVANRRDLFGLREEHMHRAQYAVIDQQGRAPDLTGEERERVFAELRSEKWKVVDEFEGVVVLRRAE